mmetsp:Transcript_117091/g.225875  ORF Transcript_117091/g.225875 Transcript_117091/m.225875 type:complete len:81 (+) Transcript_117091:505-747(+)
MFQARAAREPLLPPLLPWGVAWPESNLSSVGLAPARATPNEALDTGGDTIMGVDRLTNEGAMEGVATVAMPGTLPMGLPV